VPVLFGGVNAPLTVPVDTGSYREVVRRVLPAVVSIESSPKTLAVSGKKMPHGNPFGNIPGMPDEFKKRFEEFGQLPQEEMPHKAFGSGFIVDSRGIVVTNDHVVRGADHVVVQLQDGRKFTSHDIKKDPKTDLAIVKIDTKESLPFLEMGDSNAMEIGDRVLAIGAPLGLKGTVTTGIVSAKGRDIHMNMYEDFLQTDAAINPGNSGGPLVNLAGQVIGVNSAIKSGTGGFQGIGLAISSNLTKEVMAQLLKEGTVHRGYLGVQIQSLDPQVAEHLGLTGKGGVVIAKVTKGSPAAKAGLQSGDILTAADGKPVKDARDLQNVVAHMQRGKAMEVAVLRDGASKAFQVTIEEQPRSLAAATRGEEEAAPESEPTKLDKLGVKLADLTAESARQLGYSENTTGVVVNAVEPNSSSEEAGLKTGDLVVQIDQQPVKNMDDAQKVLAKASLEKGVLLQVQSPKTGTSYVLLKGTR
jgi:serine protease Do